MAKDKGKKAPVADEELELEDEDDEDEDEEVEEDDEETDEVEEEDEEEAAPKKKKGKPGKGNKENLVPREPISVPKAVFKAQTPEVQKLLKAREKAQAAGDKKELRKIRMALRKAGFRLSKVNEPAVDD